MQFALNMLIYANFVGPFWIFYSPKETELQVWRLQKNITKVTCVPEISKKTNKQTKCWVPTYPLGHLSVETPLSVHAKLARMIYVDVWREDTRTTDHTKSTLKDMPNAIKKGQIIWNNIISAGWYTKAIKLVAFLKFIFISHVAFMVKIYRSCYKTMNQYFPRWRNRLPL